jgi:chemotaxis protein MotB
MTTHPHHAEEGLPEWVMSYADMITILMAFFVVMYAMAGRDQSKEEAVFRALREQFRPLLPSAAALGPGPYVHRKSPLAQLAPLKTNKNTQGKSSGSDASAAERSKVHALRPGEQAAVGALIQFPEASADIGVQQKKQIEIAAREVSGKPQRVEIRGHTSRRPVPPGAPYRDNWDLAYQRCRAVMHQLIAEGIDPKRIRLGVAADNEPLPGSDDSLALHQSSRVAVTILNEPVEPDATKNKEEASAKKPITAGAPANNR